MRQISLKIPESKLLGFLELVNNLGYVKELYSFDGEDLKILKDIEASIEEVNQIKAGAKKGIPAKDLFNEL